jgi:hypothetical protein
MTQDIYYNIIAYKIPAWLKKQLTSNDLVT